jgi:hypothetical protein
MTWARRMTAANALLLLANIFGGYSLFFIYGARPDGVQPPLTRWLLGLWLLGPLWSVASLVVTLVKLRWRWETHLNGAVTVAYAAAWIVIR